MTSDAQTAFRIAETRIAIQQLRDIHRGKHQFHDNQVLVLFDGKWRLDRRCAECDALDWLQEHGL